MSLELRCDFKLLPPPIPQFGLYSSLNKKPKFQKNYIKYMGRCWQIFPCKGNIYCQHADEQIWHLFSLLLLFWFIVGQCPPKLLCKRSFYCPISHHSIVFGAALVIVQRHVNYRKLTGTLYHFYIRLDTAECRSIILSI